MTELVAFAYGWLHEMLNTIGSVTNEILIDHLKISEIEKMLMPLEIKKSIL